MADMIAERKQALEAAEEAAKLAARKRSPSPSALADRPAKTTKPSNLPSVNTAVPDDYLPPNKVLVLRDLPADYGKDNLTAIFRRFAGFKEIRMVPSRNIAFAEYEDEGAASAAREATKSMELGGQGIKVTFQRALVG
jgi:U2 small nuclear ribonucleoprotein B''